MSRDLGPCVDYLKCLRLEPFPHPRKSVRSCASSCKISKYISEASFSQLLVHKIICYRNGRNALLLLAASNPQNNSALI